jgi:hypothetical protein
MTQLRCAFPVIKNWKHFADNLVSKWCSDDQRRVGGDAGRVEGQRTVNVLVACEFSGIVRDAFIARGHFAVSCDLLPTERPGPHYQGDVRDILCDKWDLMIAHPPCTYLSRVGARWDKQPSRKEKTQEALEFVLMLACAPIKRIAIENPIGKLNSLWRYPDQTIQPYQFGHEYSKATCLWLKGLPVLLYSFIWDSEPVHFVASNTGYGRREKGQKWGIGVANTQQDRSRTFTGIAEQMAIQWGGLVVARAA